MKNSKIIIKKIPNKPEINLQIILKLIDKEKNEAILYLQHKFYIKR
jgi:hypothetical protein